jgi:hypothetical protein
MNTAQKTKKNHIKTGQQNTPYEDEKSKQALDELTPSEIKKATGKRTWVARILSIKNWIG